MTWLYIILVFWLGACLGILVGAVLAAAGRADRGLDSIAAAGTSDRLSDRLVRDFHVVHDDDGREHIMPTELSDAGPGSEPREPASDSTYRRLSASHYLHQPSGFAIVQVSPPGSWRVLDGGGCERLRAVTFAAARQWITDTSGDTRATQLGSVRTLPDSSESRSEPRPSISYIHGTRGADGTVRIATRLGVAPDREAPPSGPGATPRTPGEAR